MTIDDYEKAGDLLLKLQRLDEIQESLVESEKCKIGLKISINNLHTIIDEALMNNIINTIADYQRKIKKELEEL